MSLILLAATEASAKVAEVSGGMSLVSSEFVTALLTGVAGIVSTAVVYFKMKAKSEVAVKRPLDHDDVYMTHGECKQLRCAMEKRIDEIGPAINRIFVRLCENDRKSEERTARLHERLEPVIQKVAGNSAIIQLLLKERERDEKRNA